MVLSRTKIRDLEEMYKKHNKYQKIDVLKNLPCEDSETFKIPSSFDLSLTYFSSCDIITEVLYDLGVPSIYILSIRQKKEYKKYCVQLYSPC